MTTPTNPRGICGTVTMHEYLLEIDPDFRRREGEIEDEISDSIASGRAERAAEELVTIPVVVHVVYRTAAENISDDQVRSQIQVLNEDYRGTNADVSGVPGVWSDLVADARIQFALADEDPHGQPTDGIVRLQTDKAGFGLDDDVKFAESGGSDAWPTDRYLNIWVCTLGKVLGYAQFPGGPAETDGVVILNTAFGSGGSAVAPFDLGRTATHEVGHWLNLRHIWGDRNDCGGTDFVDDTPGARRPNYGRPTFPHVTCGNGPNGDMFVNYMDYTDDAAMFMFTVGQSERMNAALDGPRSGVRLVTADDDRSTLVG